MNVQVTHVYPLRTTGCSPCPGESESSTIEPLGRFVLQPSSGVPGRRLIAGAVELETTAPVHIHLVAYRPGEREIRQRLATRFLYALALLTLGCSSLPPNAPGPSQPDALQREFTASHPAATGSEYVPCDTPYGDHTGVSEIAIERTPCYGFCSTYTLRLFSDGRVEYTGQASVKHVGTRRGKLDEYFFRRLARSAVGIGFFELEDRYVCSVTDNPTVYVAVTRHGQRKIIEHYAPEWTGPRALTLFEEAIDAVQRYIEWSSDRD